MADVALEAMVSGRAELVEVVKAALADETVRLRVEWPKVLRGEQPIALRAPDVEEAIQLLAKRAGGRRTAAGLRVRLTPLDRGQVERLERFVAGVEPAAVSQPESPATAGDDARTGRTLPPPTWLVRGDAQTGETLPPPPMRSTEIVAASERVDERAPDSSPEIDVRAVSSIPPELSAEPDDTDSSTDEPSPTVDLDEVAQALLAVGAAEDERTLVEAGSKGAHALCRARVGAKLDAVGRWRFVSCARELGAAALGAIGASLDAALDELAQSDQSDALEDLLRAAPEIEDAALARAVIPICSHASPRARHAAIAALPKLYGAMAKPMLRDALRDEDEEVCGAAMTGLRRVRGIDGLAVRRLEPILEGEVDASEELRALAATALVDVDVDQRDYALAALVRALHPRTSLVNIFIKVEDDRPMLVEAICKTMLAIGGSKERRLVSKHAARSQPSLRRRLEALLDGNS